MVETGRRRRRSDDEKLRIVIESLQTPQAISSTARRHGISRSLLKRWQLSFRPSIALLVGFAPGIVAAGAEPVVAAAPVNGRMVIIVGKDRQVIVDADALSRLLQVLERSRIKDGTTPDSKGEQARPDRAGKMIACAATAIKGKTKWCATNFVWVQWERLVRL